MRDIDGGQWICAGVMGALSRGQVLVVSNEEPAMSLTISAFGHSVITTVDTNELLQTGLSAARDLELPCQFTLMNGLQAFRDENFSTVILTSIPKPIEAAQRLVAEAFRICRSGGRMMACIPDAEHVGRSKEVGYPRLAMTQLLEPYSEGHLRWASQIPKPWLLTWFNKPGPRSAIRSASDNLGTQRSSPTLSHLSKDRELVTVLVPTFNRAYLLRRTLDAIFAQTYRNIEVIVIDDGSTDDTAKVVRSHWGKPQYLYKPNGGKSSALNAGLALARGEYLWIADDDDLALPYKLSVQVPLLREDPSACLAYSSCFVFRGSPRNIIGFQIARELSSEMQLNALLDLELPTGRTSLYRTSAVRAVGAYDESLVRSQDLDMLLRLARRFPMHWSRVPTLLYRLHAGLRGSAADRFSPEENKDRWLAYNQQIYRKVYFGFGLSEVYPQMADGTDPIRVGAALVFRAKVMMYRLLTDYAFRDLDQAATYLGNAGEGLPKDVPDDLVENLLELQRLAIQHHADKLSGKICGIIKLLCRQNQVLQTRLIDYLALQLKEATGPARACYLRCLVSLAFGLDYKGSWLAFGYLLKRVTWSIRCRIFPVRTRRASKTPTQSRIGEHFSS